MPGKKYTAELKSFIAANVAGRTTKELVDIVNERFSTDFTESKMRSYKKNHDLKSGTPCGLPAGRPTTAYPEEVQKFIAENYTGTGHKDMADLLNKTFGTNYTPARIKGYYANHKLDSGLKGHFTKGHTPFNKGKKKFWVGGEATQFKKGNTPVNYRPVGSERINVDGYVEIKVADPNKWRLKQRVIWEQHKGPIPKGHVVIFGDGNSLNLDVNNLILVSNSQLAVLNRKGLIQNDADLTRTGVIMADIYQKISQRKKKVKA